MKSVQQISNPSDEFLKKGIQLKDQSSFQRDYNSICEQYNSEILVLNANSFELCLVVKSRENVRIVNRADLFFSTYKLFRDQIPEKLRLAIKL